MDSPDRLRLTEARSGPRVCNPQRAANAGNLEMILWRLLQEKTLGHRGTERREGSGCERGNTCEWGHRFFFSSSLRLCVSASLWRNFVMPFDPNVPQENTDLDAAQVRAQLNALKALIDNLPGGTSVGM